MKQLHDLYRHILDNGEEVSDRTGVGTLSVFGYQMRFDLSKGFPIATGKKMMFDSISSELLWFMEGSTDERRLAELRFGKERELLVGKNTIWTANADNQGKALGYHNDDLCKDLGPVYGKQWRDVDGSRVYADGSSTKINIDQLKNLLRDIRNNPDSRRLIISSWNVAEIDQMTLPPCHTLVQFKVASGKLHCQLYQRSADTFLGIPYNVASYALLVHLIARETGLEPGDFVHTIGDAHIYMNHVDAVKEYLEAPTHDLPTLVIDKSFKIRLNSEYDLNEIEKIKLEKYTSNATIRAPMAV